MRRRWKPAWPAGITALALLLLAATAVAQDGGFSLRSWTATGGGGALQSAGYSLQASIGQPGVGQLAGDGYRIDGGFWAEDRPVYKVYLPSIYRVGSMP